MIPQEPDRDWAQIAAALSNEELPDGWQVVPSSNWTRVAHHAGDGIYYKEFLTRAPIERIKARFTGSRATLTRSNNHSLELAGFESRVVELSWYGTREVSLPLGQAFHRRRLSLVSSQVGSVATAQRGRWDHRRRLSLALDLLDDPSLDRLITGEDPFERLAEVQARLATSPADTLMHRIRYDQGAT